MSDIVGVASDSVGSIVVDVRPSSDDEFDDGDVPVWWADASVHSRYWSTMTAATLVTTATGSPIRTSRRTEIAIPFREL